MRHIVRRLGALTAMVVVAAAAVVAGGQNPRELFERAKLLEENPRNLARAVQLYQQVTEQAKSDRALAAAAQLRIAMAKERQGKPDTRAAYAAILRDYKDQTATVNIARARLAAVGG